MEKEKVLNGLKNLGFRLEEVPEIGYSFIFEGLNIILTVDENNQEIVNLALPYIYEGNDDNRVILLDIANEMNLRMKYAKTVLRGNSVWVTFEADVYNEESIEPTLQLGVYSLQAGKFFFDRLMSGEDKMASFNDDEQGEEDGDGQEETDNQE